MKIKPTQTKQKQILLEKIYELNTKLFPETLDEVAEFEAKYGTTDPEGVSSPFDLSEIYKSDLWLNRFKKDDKAPVRFAMAARFDDIEERISQENIIKGLIDDYEKSTEEYV